MTRCHDCADKYLAAAEETVCRQLIDRFCLRPPTGESIIATRGRALDVGAGTSGAGRRILEGWEYWGIDPYINIHDENVWNRDILKLKVSDWRAAPFDLILCKRVLCQMTDDEVSRAVANMYDLLRPGGHLLVCEPWRAEREALCALRHLPMPASGGTGVPKIGGVIWADSCMGGADVLEPLADVPVAPDYVLWSRAFGYDTKRSDPEARLYWAYDDPRRELYPAFPPEVQERFAFYRARLWRKA